VGLINQCGRPQHVLLVHGEAGKLRAFRRRVATELKLPCAAPPNGTVVTIDCSRSAEIGDAASSSVIGGQLRNQPIVAGHRPPTTGVPAKVDLLGIFPGGESREPGLSFASSETMIESRAENERMQARGSTAAAFCELRWVLDVVPPVPDPTQEVTSAAVGSKRRRGQNEDEPMRRETTAGQIMADMVDVFRK
jgi:hypothetical protein